MKRKDERLPELMEVISGMLRPYLACVPRGLELLDERWRDYYDVDGERERIMESAYGPDALLGMAVIASWRVGEVDAGLAELLKSLCLSTSRDRLPATWSVTPREWCASRL